MLMSKLLLVKNKEVAKLVIARTSRGKMIMMLRANDLTWFFEWFRGKK